MLKQFTIAGILFVQFLGLGSVLANEPMSNLSNEAETARTNEKVNPIVPHFTANTKTVYLDFRPNDATTDFNSGVCLVRNRNFMYAIFDKQGNQITDFKFSCNKYAPQTPIFENGFCAIRDEQGSYIIDTKGNIITPRKKIYNLSNFENGIATAEQYVKNPKNPYSNVVQSVYVNTKGEIIFKHLSSIIEWGRVEPMRPFLNGLAAFKDYKLQRWGFINQQGQVIIKPIYKEVQNFSEHHAAVLTEGGKWIFINEQGKKAINAEFAKKPSQFSGGFAKIYKRAGGISLINTEGRVVLDGIESITPFYNHYAFVRFDVNSENYERTGCGYKTVLIDDLFKTHGVVNLHGDKFKYSDNGHAFNPDGLIETLNGLVSAAGDLIYADVHHLFYDDLALCSISDENYHSSDAFINRAGEIVLIFKESTY